MLAQPLPSSKAAPGAAETRVGHPPAPLNHHLDPDPTVLWCRMGLCSGKCDTARTEGAKAAAAWQGRQLLLRVGADPVQEGTAGGTPVNSYCNSPGLHPDQCPMPQRDPHPTGILAPFPTAQPLGCSAPPTPGHPSTLAATASSAGASRGEMGREDAH